jgi:pimeloyl-ACP methyl ester carboxylesterase
LLDITALFNEHHEALFRYLSRLTGDADLYLPPPVLEVLAARIPTCQSLVIPGCGHSAYWEQPALFNQAVLAFIDNH